MLAVTNKKSPILVTALTLSFTSEVKKKVNMFINDWMNNKKKTNMNAPQKHLYNFLLSFARIKVSETSTTSNKKETVYSTITLRKSNIISHHFFYCNNTLCLIKKELKQTIKEG